MCAAHSPKPRLKGWPAAPQGKGAAGDKAVKAEVKKEAAKPAAKPAAKAAADKKADAANGKAAAKVKEEKQPKEKKEFDMPGQTREAPPEVRFRHQRRYMLRHHQSACVCMQWTCVNPHRVAVACMSAQHRHPEGPHTVSGVPGNGRLAPLAVVEFGCASEAHLALFWPQNDSLRKFYTSLLEQRPESEMAKKWCVADAVREWDKYNPLQVFT